MVMSHMTEYCQPENQSWKETYWLICSWYANKNKKPIGWFTYKSALHRGLKRKNIGFFINQHQDFFFD